MESIITKELVSYQSRKFKGMVEQYLVSFFGML